jgi:hypothetical protein
MVYISEKVSLINKTFGRLTVIEEIKKRGKNRYFKCLCQCGKYTETQYGGLTGGTSKSCGCLMRENSSRQGKKNMTHGMTKTPMYRVWCAMRNRCYNPNVRGYSDYGGRGIKVCKAWKNSFEQFLQDMGERPEGAQIDRIDNNGNYCKENCRWASRTTNARNKRTSMYIVFNGVETHIVEISKQCNINAATLRARIRSGNFSDHQVVTEKLHSKPSLRRGN